MKRSIRRERRLQVPEMDHQSKTFLLLDRHPDGRYYDEDDLDDSCSDRDLVTGTSLEIQRRDKPYAPDGFLRSDPDERHMKLISGVKDVKGQYSISHPLRS